MLPRVRTLHDQARGVPVNTSARGVEETLTQDEEQLVAAHALGCRSARGPV